MIWKYLEQNVLIPKDLNWVQHWVSRFGLFSCLIINIGQGEVTAAWADDELCIDRLYLFNLLFLNYTSSVAKIRNDLFVTENWDSDQFFFNCCGDLDHLSTGANSSHSVWIPLGIFRCGRWSFDSPYILIDELTGITVSKKLIILL